MNKTELVECVATKAELTKKDAESAINAVLSCITDELSASGKVRLVGFGSLSVKDRAARTGRDPKTREPLLIPATRTVAFTAGKELKRQLNEKSNARSK